MADVLDAESTLTDRYQTTVPEPVRRALQLHKRDKIRYVIRSNGEVVLSRADQVDDAEDPVLARFLAFLAEDMARHPDRLQPLDEAFAARLRALTEGVEVDLDAPLSPDDE